MRPVAVWALALLARCHPAGAVQPLTVAAKAAFAHRHNAARCAVGVASLSWDDDDAAAAAALASTCAYSKSAYVGLANGGRGESLHAVSFHQPPEAAAAAASEGFLAEAANWDCDGNSCSSSAGSSAQASCLHYTQAVWEDTTTLGCAVEHCTTGSPFPAGGDWTLVVCEYSPAGNFPAYDRPFATANCNGQSTCAGDGSAPDSAAVEGAITADAGAVADVTCASDPDAAERIDLLALYTKEALEAAGGAVQALEDRIRAGVGEANDALGNSQVELLFNLTAIELAPQSFTQSSGELLQALTDSLAVKARRDFWAADLVFLVAEVEGGQEETASWVLGSASGDSARGFSVVQSRSLTDGHFALARSLGHNLGCVSDVRHSSVTPLTPYGYGLRQLSREPYFRTVMASGKDCPLGDGDGCPVLPYYSRSEVTAASCDGVATDTVATPDCTAVAAFSADPVAANCPAGCTFVAAELLRHTFDAALSVTNCSEGYSPGNASDPSTTCPLGCSLTVATAAIPASCGTGNDAAGNPCEVDDAGTGCVAANGTCVFVPDSAGTEESCIDTDLEPISLLVGSASADCARTIETAQAAVANYRIADDSSCGGVGTAGVLSLTGVPALPPKTCKNDCSFHGSCDYASMQCRCRLPWQGDDCSERACPDGCGGRGSCDTQSGACKCHGGWTGKSCSIRIENFCPDDCAGGAGGGCDYSTGHCHCTRSFDWNMVTDYSSEMKQCVSAEGTCWESGGHARETSAPRVQRAIGEVGVATSINAREQMVDGRQGGTEDGWTLVQLRESYGTPVVFVAPPTDNEATPAAARLRNLRHDASEPCGGWCFELRLQEMECADDDIHLAEQLDYLVVEAGAWESWESANGYGNQVYAGTYQTDGSAAAPIYEPVTYDIDLTAVNPPTLYVNAGDIIKIAAPASWGGDVWRIPDSACDFDDSYWRSQATRIATADQAEEILWEVPIWPNHDVGYWFATKCGVSVSCHEDRHDEDGNPCQVNSDGTGCVVANGGCHFHDTCDDCDAGRRQLVSAKPLERGCARDQGAAAEHPGHRQGLSCCYGETLLSHGGSLSCGAGDGWSTVRWPFGMSAPPIVLSQVQTYMDSRAVTTRHADVTTSGARIRLQDDFGGPAGHSGHEAELVGVLVFSTDAEGRFNRRRFEAVTAVVGSSAATEITFRQDFGSRPRVFAAMQSVASVQPTQLRMLGVSERAAQSREGDGGAMGVAAPLRHDLTPAHDSRSVSGDYGDLMPPTASLHSNASRLAQRRSRRAWAYLQPRNGSICDTSVVRQCGGDMWSRGIVGAGLRPCGGGVCVEGSLPLCEAPAGGTAQTGADCAASFAAGGGEDASACPGGCSFRAGTGECPTDIPQAETVGFVAMEVGSGGAGTLQGYAVPYGPGDDGDCAVFAGPQACNGRGRMPPEPQADRSDCECEEGFFGHACQYAQCPRDCSGRGRCQHTTLYDHHGGVRIWEGTCECHVGAYGDGCQYLNCPDDCNSRGRCDATTGTCTCSSPFRGPSCAAGPCDPPCANGGTCDERSGACVCAPLFFGLSCNVSASPAVATEACAGTAANASVDCAAAFAAAGGTGSANCPSGCNHTGSDGTRGHERNVG